MDDDSSTMQGMEASMDEYMPERDEVEAMDAYEKTCNKYASAWANERALQDSYN